MNNHITRSINKGASFLAQKQRDDGSFLSFSSTDKRTFSNSKAHRSVFQTALILSSIGLIADSPLLKKIKGDSATFLLGQKSEYWSFNYWVRASKDAKISPYPDDLDDTFCAVSALYLYDQKIIDGKALAKIVSLLTHVEEKEGGPYRTWLVPEDAKSAWKDVDLAVNSNVAYFLSLQDVYLENINDLAEKAAAKDAYHSQYYVSPFSVIYFISRFYKGKKSDAIIKFILKNMRNNGGWGNPLDTAFAVSALINLGHKIDSDKSMNYLISHQKNGAWKPYPFGIELVKKGRTHYSGSSALTTAFCLEALNKFKDQNLKTKIANQDLKIGKRSKVQKEIIKKARQRISMLDDDLKKHSLKYLNKTLSGSNGEQIVLMPYIFKTALRGNGEAVSDEFIIELGLANLYGWMAYTIYDDFLDEEGDPRALSAANIYLRELTHILDTILPESAEFQKFFHKTLDVIDAANAWETTNARDTSLLKIPRWGNLSKLADRSIGHALGPAAILFSLGYGGNSTELKNLMLFFKHYLIARQLNDDAHDWEKDMMKGHISPVVARVLRKVKEKGVRIDKGDLAPIQGIFWHEIIDGVCDDVEEHAYRAREAAKKIPLLKDSGFYENMLTSVLASAQKAKKEKAEMLKFLHNY